MVLFAMYLAGSIDGHLYFREHVAGPILNYGRIGKVGIFGPSHDCGDLHRLFDLVQAMGPETMGRMSLA